jgi:NAD(P)H dehydrogenase (quinone)
MNIGVSGASGHLGSATVRELKARLGAKANIVAISRTPDKIAALGVETRAGDFDKPETLTDAFRGLDKLVVIPTSDMVAGARSEQACAAIDEAVAAGVRHITYVSAVGTRFAELPHLWESYFVPEQALMRSAKQWSILRMAYYAENFLDRAKMSLAQGVYASSSSVPVNFVSRDDVAAAAAGLIATEGHHGAIYNATGPETLDGAARAAVVAKVTGKPFAFVQVPCRFLPGSRPRGSRPPSSTPSRASRTCGPRGPSTSRRATSRVSRDGRPAGSSTSRRSTWHERRHPTSMGATQRPALASLPRWQPPTSRNDAATRCSSRP